jgi:hypothetical protein
MSPAMVSADKIPIIYTHISLQGNLITVFTEYTLHLKKSG